MCTPRFVPRLRSILLSVGPALLLVTAAAATILPPETVQDRLRLRIEAAQQDVPDALTAEGETVRARAALMRFYEDRSFEPAWIDADGPTPLADSLLAALQRADREGLRPADYHTSLLASVHERVQRRARSNQSLHVGRRSDFELLYTDAFLVYGGHLLTGRVDPVELTPSWTLGRREADLVNLLAETVSTGTIPEALDRLRPSHPEYSTLINGLARYRRLAAEGGWPTVPEGPKLEREVASKQVDALRRRLRATGDLAADTSTDPQTFDEPLHAAVVRFQERHGLDADGVVGPNTRAALNVPVEHRIQQIEVNLERWRWLPQKLGDPHVRVNIAGFWLRVVEDGRDALQMRVVTGRPYRQTPVFSDQISYLVFSPYWNVPHSIATRDKLPEFKKNPSLASKQGFEFFRGWGADAAPIPHANIDWGSLSASNFPYRMRQRPGPQNALGQVKFMFPNAHSVYLHDTPSRTLFQRGERSFSSGCIRVERPGELATYLLQHNEGWDTNRVQSAMERDREHTVSLKQHVPVHLLYWTAWVEDDTIHFRRDIYERDGPLAAALVSETPHPRR